MEQRPAPAPGGHGAPLGYGRASGSLALLPPLVLLQAAREARRDLRLVLRAPASGDLVVLVFRQGELTMVFSPGDGRSVGELLLAAGKIDVEILDGLVDGRSRGATSLERLILARTALPQDELRTFLNFQARMRLLEVLAWREGFFELSDYSGGGETAFCLDLPQLEALALRAQARSTALPALLARLPAAPENTLVRRRRGAQQARGQLERAILDAVSAPLVLTQLLARLLVDDDVAIEATLRLAQARALTLTPRVALAPQAAGAPARDPRLADLVREILARTRGEAAAKGAVTLWVLVVSSAPPDAARLVASLAGDEGEPLSPEHAGGATGFARRTLRLAPEVRVCLLALRPRALSRAALEGVLARFDALMLLRLGDESAELEQLQQLRRLAAPAESAHRPLVLGFDLTRSLRSWGDFPDAVFGIPGGEGQKPSWLFERLLEGLLAAAAAR
ncbi:MAG: DUF4388 domain-containing protein [Acidobacteriota bacterium]